MEGCCYVSDESGEWPGRVLRWLRTGDGWSAVVRYSRRHESGHLLNYERWVDSAALRPREDRRGP